MITLVCGPPCAGKTTLASSLGASEVVDYDAIAHEYGSVGWDHTPEIRSKVRAEVERRLASISGDAVVIRSAPDPVTRLDLAERIKADKVLVLDIPAEEAKMRAEADGRPEWTSEAIDNWWRRYSPLPIDTSMHPGGAGRNPDSLEDEEMTEQETQATEETAAVWADPESAKSVIEKLRKENASWRTKYRELEPLANKAAELEESSKSELQKLLERAEKAEKLAGDANTRLLRSEVAASTGLPVGLVDRLTGNTKEELEADAQALMSLVQPKQEKTVVDLGQGVRGKAAAKPDMSTLIRAAFGK